MTYDWSGAPTYDQFPGYRVLNMRQGARYGQLPPQFNMPPPAYGQPGMSQFPQFPQLGQQPGYRTPGFPVAGGAEPPSYRRWSNDPTLSPGIGGSRPGVVPPEARHVPWTPGSERQMLAKGYVPKRLPGGQMVWEWSPSRAYHFLNPPGYTID